MIGPRLSGIITSALLDTPPFNLAYDALDRLYRALDQAEGSEFEVTDEGYISEYEYVTDQRRTATRAKFLGRFWNTMFPNAPSRGETKRPLMQVSQRLTLHWPTLAKLNHCIVKGQDLVQAYSDIHSCVSNDLSLLDFYLDNSVELFLIKDENGTPRGRALLWTLDDGETYLDRVYPGDQGPQTSYAREVAVSNGWIHRNHDHAYEYDITPNVPLKVTLKDVNKYPWMDTLRFVMRDGKGNLIMSNHNPDDTENHVAVQQNQFGHDPFLAVCEKCEIDYENERLERYNIGRGVHDLRPHYNMSVCPHHLDTDFSWSDQYGRFIADDDYNFIWSEHHNRMLSREDHAAWLAQREEEPEPSPTTGTTFAIGVSSSATDWDVGEWTAQTIRFTPITPTPSIMNALLDDEHQDPEI